jgi:hypothetical protein
MSFFQKKKTIKNRHSNELYNETKKANKNMSKRFRDWQNIKASFDRTKKCHDIRHCGETKDFIKANADESKSQLGLKAFQSAPPSCGCEDCIQFICLDNFELTLEIMKRGINVENRCSECGATARSNKAQLCDKIGCYNAKKKRILSKRPKVALNQSCVMCHQPLRRPGAKLCGSKNCYNARHRELRAIKRKSRDAALPHSV